MEKIFDKLLDPSYPLRAPFDYSASGVAIKGLKNHYLNDDYGNQKSYEVVKTNDWCSCNPIPCGVI